MKINAQSRLIAASLPKELKDADSDDLKYFIKTATEFGIDINTAKFIPVNNAREASKILKNSDTYSIVVGMNVFTRTTTLGFAVVNYSPDAPTFKVYNTRYKNYRNIKQFIDNFGLIYVIEGNKETKKRLDELVLKRQNSKAPVELQRGKGRVDNQIQYRDKSGYVVDKFKYENQMFIKNFARIREIAYKIIPAIREYLKYKFLWIVTSSTKPGGYFSEYNLKDTPGASANILLNILKSKGISERCVNTLLESMEDIDDKEMLRLQKAYNNDLEFFALAKMSDQEVQAIINKLEQETREAKEYVKKYNVV